MLLVYGENGGSRVIPRAALAATANAPVLPLAMLSCAAEKMLLMHDSSASTQT